MSDLIARLRAAIDETERIALAATPGPWRVDSEGYPETIYGNDDYVSVVSGGRWGGEANVFDNNDDAMHIAHHHPKRELDMVAAHRELLDWLERASELCASDADHFGLSFDEAVAILAKGYGIEP